MEELLMNVANFGFPIVIAFYLLCRMEGKIEKLTESIVQLNSIISKIK